MPYNQYAVNYAVRNLTILDDEQTRLYDLADEEWEDFPVMIRKPLRYAIDNRQLDTALNLLLPYITDSKTYHSNFPQWQDILFK